MRYKYKITFVDDDDGFDTDVELHLNRHATPEDIADRLASWNIYDHPIKVELLDVMVEIDPDVEAQKDWAEKLDRLHKLANLSRKLKRVVEKLRATEGAE